MKFKEILEKIKQFFKNLTPKQRMYIYIGLVLGFILINSMLGGSVSMWLSEIPKKFVQFFIPYGKVKWLDDFLINHIRKFMHFFEYLIFGVLVSKYYFFKNKTINRLINSAFIILTIAFVDETIQIFSGRESLISDIWLDLFGGITGIIIYFMYKYIKFYRKQKEKSLWLIIRNN